MSERREDTSTPARAQLSSQGSSVGHLPGRARAWAPPPRPPALLPRPARGRHGSGGARCLARAAPFFSCSGCGPGGRDVPEPQASAAFPGPADVNSFLPRGKEAVCLHPPSRGGPAAWWGPGATGRLPGEKGETWARARFPPQPTLERERPAWLRPGLLQAKGGGRIPDVTAGPGAGWQLPRAPGARAGARRPRCGVSAKGGHVGPRAGCSRGARPDLQ